MTPAVLRRRLATLAAKLPPDTRHGHTHAVVRTYILGQPPPPDGALDAYLTAHHRPCHCAHPWALLLVWDGERWAEDPIQPPEGWPPREGMA